MEILLMCPGASSGQASFVAELIEGIRAPERRYDIQDGKIVLSGFDDVILHHDADVLLANPLYRMPTPAEQESFVQQAQQSGQIQENTEQEMDSVSGLSESEQGLVSESDTPPAVDNTPANADSTAQSKKKASGG